MSTPTLAGETAALPAPAIDVRSINLGLLDADPTQPRRSFDQEALRGLSQSIAADGLLQPIVARPVDGGRYQIIAGERRAKAALMAGLPEAPVIVRADLVGKDVLVLQLVENIEREGLALSELAAGVHKLVQTIGAEETARRLKKSAAWVSRHAALVNLPEPVKAAVEQGVIASVDVAADLGRLHQLNKQTAERRLGDFTYAAKPDTHHRPPTRAQIRDDLKRAEDARRKKEEEKAEAKALREKAKADPKLAAQLKKQKAEKTPDGRQERAKRISAFRAAAQPFIQDTADALYQRAGVPKPKGRANYDSPLRISAPSMVEWGSDPIPENVDAAKFDVDCCGTFDEIAAMARLINPEPKLDVQFHGDVTIIEARRMAEVLGSRVRFHFEETRTGKKLRALATDPIEPAGAGKKPKGLDPKDPFGVAAFLKACTVKATPAHRVSSADLHGAYAAWARANPDIDEPLKMPDPRWSQQLKANGLTVIRSNGMKWSGIKLKGGAA